MKIKILYIHHNAAIGGATNSLLYNAVNLPKDRFDVNILFLEKNGPAIELFQNQEFKLFFLDGITNYQHAENAIIKWISIHPLKPITQFFSMIKSIKIFKEFYIANNFDIIHINTSVILAAGLAAKSLKIRTVWHIREPIAKGVIGLRRIIIRKIINHCAIKIIAISKEDARKLGKSEKIVVVYNFVDFSFFDKDVIQTSIHKELGLSPDIKLVVMLGGTVHSKGADIFLKAIPLVLHDYKNVHFIVVGYPLGNNSNSVVSKLKKIFFNMQSVSEKCKVIIKKHNLEKHVTFLGLRKDIPAILKSTNILVWPATIGHFSRPIIEAQSMATPSVGTNFASTREIIEDRNTGLLFPIKDFVTLSQCINELLNDEVLYRRIADNGYSQARKLFDKDKNILKVLNVYDKVLENS